MSIAKIWQAVQSVENEKWGDLGQLGVTQGRRHANVTIL